jgi:hypothetical protein
VELRYVEAAMRRRGGDHPGTGATPGAPMAGSSGRRSATYRTEAELLRLYLANDRRLAGVEVDPELFTDEDMRAAHGRVAALIGGLPAGEPPDLGAAIGSEDSAMAELLRTLAMDDRPLADPEDLVAMLDIARIDREIDGAKQALQQVDRDSDEQTYSELWQRLIALEQHKRDRRGER